MYEDVQNTLNSTLLKENKAVCTYRSYKWRPKQMFHIFTLRYYCKTIEKNT